MGQKLTSINGKFFGKFKDLAILAAPFLSPLSGGHMLTFDTTLLIGMYILKFAMISWQLVLEKNFRFLLKTSMNHMQYKIIWFYQLS